MTSTEHKYVCKYFCTIYVVLFSIIFTIKFGIGTYFVDYKYIKHDKKILVFKHWFIKYIKWMQRLKAKILKIVHITFLMTWLIWKLWFKLIKNSLKIVQIHWCLSYWMHHNKKTDYYENILSVYLFSLIIGKRMDIIKKKKMNINT